MTKPVPLSMDTPPEPQMPAPLYGLAGMKVVSSAPDVVLMAITCVVVIERKFRDKLRACAR